MQKLQQIMETNLGYNKEKNIKQKIHLEHRIESRTGYRIKFKVKQRIEFTSNKIWNRK